VGPTDGLEGFGREDFSCPYYKSIYIRNVLGFGFRWEDNIEMGLQEVGWGAWTGLIWLRIGTGGGLL
jgi:hypothetical protein